MNLFVEERDGGEFAFWADGDLQFDSADEAIYHELLALPALTLAKRDLPIDQNGMRVLICGGGDGLALREVLRFPGVSQVDLVDYSADVVELGRTRFAELNREAFADPRATVHIADAWEFLRDVTTPYDVILCDFTTPRRTEDTRIMTREWYECVASALAPQGVAGINAVSPQTTPEAFWCLRATVRAGGLNALPFRAGIPSFRAQGYGTWAFLLAGHRRLRRADLRDLNDCPVGTVSTDLANLWETAAFTHTERLIEARVPVHTLEEPCLLPLLLNPGSKEKAGALPLPALDGLMASIPILHPYHTRIMVESLAEQVVGSVQALDLRRLVDSLLLRVSELPANLKDELRRLRDFLSRGNAPRLADWNLWAQRLFAIIVVIMTLANLVAPDNVFGKGSFGLGHASVSRSFSASGHSFGRSSFSRTSASGYAAPSRASSGSFGRPSAATVSASRPTAPISGRGFRGGFQRGEPTDYFGNSYRPRTFVYIHTGGYGYQYHGGYAGGHYNMSDTSGASGSPVEQKARFVADDDMMVMDNGDVIITLSDTAFLVVSGGSVSLHSNGNAAPLFRLYPHPLLFENIITRLQGQKEGLQTEMKTRKEWLEWVGWTSPMFSSIKGDQAELNALQDLNKRLDTALARVGTSDKKTPPPDLPENQAKDAIELFSAAGLLTDGRVALIDETGRYLFTDGKTIGDGKTSEACPPGLATALSSVLAKLEKEFRADLTESGSDLVTLQSDKQSLDKDLADYTTLSSQYGPSYEVDYGTDSMSAQEALNRTNADLVQNATDTAETLKAQTTLNGQINRLWTAADTFATAGKR
jgi:spermidine synthase